METAVLETEVQEALGVDRPHQAGPTGSQEKAARPPPAPLEGLVEVLVAPEATLASMR